MSRIVACILAASLMTLAPALSSAQVIRIDGAQGFPPPPPPPPGAMPMFPRDTPAKTGTAQIRGRVVAADTGQPLRKAQIRVFSPELRENRSASTDAEGRYEFKELPAGRYNVSVSKGSFVTLSYGQRRPFEAGKPLEILDTQVIEKVDFALPRGGVITGRIADEFGESVADARVTALRFQFIQGRRQLTPAGRPAMTNDIGEYRIFGLAPSQYFLSATLQGMGGMMIATAGGVVGGGDSTGYAPTYYPGTPNVAEAQRITVGIGQIINEMNLALVPTRTARVSGTAVDASGKPLSGGMAMAMQRSGTMISSASGGQVRPDGTFTIPNLSPGEYIIQAMTPGALGDLGEIAIAQVTVAGEDVTGVQLMGQRSITATGRLIVDASAAKQLQPSSIRMMAQPANPGENMLGGIGTGKVNDDFTFEVKSRPGHSLIRFASLPTGWGLKAVRQHGADVTDTGIEFRPNEDVSGIEIELTNQPTEVSGLVTNTRSEPVKDYTVVVFARDRERWGYMSRYFQTGRPDQDGRFKVRALPAGEYYAVALEYVEPGEATDPEFLDRVKGSATSFSLREGETKILDLKISTPSS